MLDRAGACCDGAVDACGVCNGSGQSTDFTGACCAGALVSPPGIHRTAETARGHVQHTCLPCWCQEALKSIGCQYSNIVLSMRAHADSGMCHGAGCNTACCIFHATIALMRTIF